MRVFVPTTFAGLAELVAHGRIDPPVAGHAVTAGLEAAWPQEPEEVRDYAALMAAAFDSLCLLAASGGRRRAVIAVDVPGRAVRGADVEDLTAVVVTTPVALDQVASVHVDDPGAGADVDVALERVAAALDGDPEALAVVALEDHELAWYARQEIPDLLG